MSMCREGALRARFLANFSVFYIVDGVKGDLIICFNVFKLLRKDHVNNHATLN